MSEQNIFNRRNVIILIVIWIILASLVGLMLFLRSDDNDDRYSVTIEPQVVVTNNTYREF